MSKEDLLKTEFDSACAAMQALEDFLRDIDNSRGNDSRANYQNLKVVGNRIYD